MDRQKQIVRVSFLGIAANLVLVAFKAGVGLVTGSIAVILDAVNNLSDALSSVITIVGTKLASRPPDKKHPSDPFSGPEGCFFCFLCGNHPLKIFAIGLSGLRIRVFSAPVMELLSASSAII